LNEIAASWNYLRLLNAAGGGAHAGSADGISLAQALEAWHRMAPQLLQPL